MPVGSWRSPEVTLRSPSVSFVVPVACARGRPPRPIASTHPRSRTVPARRERWGAYLESVLGATPQEFESLILRHADLLKHWSSVPTGRHAELCWSHLLVSVGWPGSYLRWPERRIGTRVFAGHGVGERPRTERRTPRNRAARTLFRRVRSPRRLPPRRWQQMLDVLAGTQQEACMSSTSGQVRSPDRAGGSPVTRPISRCLAYRQGWSCFQAGRCPDELAPNTLKDVGVMDVDARAVVLRWARWPAADRPFQVSRWTRRLSGSQVVGSSQRRNANGRRAGGGEAACWRCLGQIMDNPLAC